MAQETQYLAAFVVGLLGGVHCVGMCGGIVGALVFGLPEASRNRIAVLLPFLLAYNGGRLLSYAAAGGLLGGISWLAANAVMLRSMQQVLQGVAGVFMVALGLYLAGWWLGLQRVERAGGVLWRRLEPVGRRLFPVHSVPQAFVVGTLWGWLPCGLVYSVLVWTMASGSPWRGALMMFSFGLGTLPTLLATGAVAGGLASLARQPRVRQAAGTAVMLFGLYTLALALGLVPDPA